MSISMSSTTGFGNHSPSQSFSVAGGGAGAGGGAAGGLSLSGPSSFRRTFAVSSLKSLNRRQNYVLVLDFEKSLVSFHKVRKGKEVKRSFPFAACVKLERGNGGGGGGGGGAAGGAGGAKGATALVATFGHEPKYKKALFFASTDERELFCNLVHAMIVSGSRAVTLFKGLQSAAQAQAAPGAAAQPNANAAGAGAGAGTAGAGSASAVSGKNGADADGKDVVVSCPDANEVVAGMDFCDFLISFSSAQTQLSHSQALHSTAKAVGGGAGGRGGGGGGGAKGPGFDEHDLAIGGGRARANANDPQAAILQFLADNANNADNGASGGGASAINGLASSNLISLLNGRLLEGETPVNSSDITYRSAATHRTAHSLTSAFVIVSSCFSSSSCSLFSPFVFQCRV